MKKTKAEVIKEYKEFLHYVMDEKKVNFHPDDSFEDIINIKTNEPLFSKEEAKVLDTKMDYFFNKLGDNVYTIALEKMNELLN